MGDGDDRREITDLLLRYAWAIDSKDWPLLHSCFTLDCAVSYGNGNSPHPRGSIRFAGADELTAYMQRTHDPLDSSLHRITNIQVELTGLDTAAARSYGDNLLVLKAAADGPFYESAGYYTDEVVRQRGVWRIATRRYARVWAQGNAKVIQPGA